MAKVCCDTSSSDHELCLSNRVRSSLSRLKPRKSAGTGNTVLERQHGFSGSQWPRSFEMHQCTVFLRTFDEMPIAVLANEG